MPLSRLDVGVRKRKSWTAPSVSPAPATKNVPAPDSNEVNELLNESSTLLTQGKQDDALRKVDAALQIDPKNTLAYTLRAAIYAQEKLWDRAEQDYQTAYKIAPSEVVFKYNMAELQFMQKAYDNARPGFFALQHDKELGDLASYKVYLCDLFSRRNDIADKEREAIKKTGESPAYYYSNVAWYLIHQQKEEADTWLSSALQRFDAKTNDPYLKSLIEAGIEAPTVTFLTKSGITYEKVRAFIESNGLRVGTSTGWVTVPFDQLPDDLSPFPQELRKQILTRRNLSPFAPGKIKRLSFITKQGTHYDQVQVYVENNGLSVLTSDGWFTVPFKQLPDDLSPFPPELQKEIVEKRLAPPDITPALEFLTFTTKTGQHYDEVRALVEDSGLSVLTPAGWAIIPFQQLPDDLSNFPVDMQKQIAEKRLAPREKTVVPEFFSFTTKQGKHYDQVRVSVESDGLGVLTQDGQFIVPFRQLPDDLSPFPEALRKQIGAKEQQETAAESKQASLSSQIKSLIPASTADGAKSQGIGSIDPEQTDLYPANAKDCLFGSCVAVEGSTLVVGCNGATYVYENNKLTARLCPDADTSQTGDKVNSVSISNHTIAIGTHRGVYVWVDTTGGWKLQAHLLALNPSTVVLDNDQLVVGSNGKGISDAAVSFYARNGDTWISIPGGAGHNRDSHSADLFGDIVALKNQRALIGAPNWSKASYEGLGSLYAGRAYVGKV